MIIVARPFGGTSLNGLEFLLDGPDGDFKKFENKEAAKAFLRENDLDATDEEMEDYYRFMTEEEVEAYESDNSNAQG